MGCEGVDSREMEGGEDWVKERGRKRRGGEGVRREGRRGGGREKDDGRERGGR